jgi:hypothetical protein
MPCQTAIVLYDALQDVSKDDACLCAQNISLAITIKHRRAAGEVGAALSLSRLLDMFAVFAWLMGTNHGLLVSIHGKPKTT